VDEMVWVDWCVCFVVDLFDCDEVVGFVVCYDFGDVVGCGGDDW